MRYLLKKASKPTVKITEVTHKYINHFYYYPGRMEWEPISITFASGKSLASATIGTNGVLSGGAIQVADKTIIDLLTSAGYIFPSSTVEGQRKTISKQEAVSAVVGAGGTGKRTCKLFTIDAAGKEQGVYYLHNPMLMDVKFDTLEYASEEILNIECTLRYDYATIDQETNWTA